MPSSAQIRIPYTRVADERVLEPGAGPLAPGDLAYVSKTPNGFFPERGHHLPPLGGAQAISTVLGLQGLNDHLEGKGTAGLQVGWNVLDLGVDGTPSAVLPDAQDGRFKLGLLDSFRLDGVVISNEAAHSTQSDDCVLNICIQGACTRAHTRTGHVVPPPPGTRLLRPTRGAQVPRRSTMAFASTTRTRCRRARRRTSAT